MDVTRTPLIFQEKTLILLSEHIKFSGRTKNGIGTPRRSCPKVSLEHKRFSRRKKYHRTDQIFQEILSKISLEHKRFSRRKKYNRTDQIFQEILSKISLEHIRFSRRKKYHKNRSIFPGELSRNFVRTRTIFQETIPPRTDIL